MAFKDVFKEIDYKYILCVVFMKAVVPMVIRAIGLSADKLGEIMDEWLVSTFNGEKNVVQHETVSTNTYSVKVAEKVTHSETVSSATYNRSYNDNTNILHSGSEVVELHNANYSLVE